MSRYGWRLAAELVWALHVAFAAFVALGGVAAWWWPAILWLHVPCAAWTVLMQLWPLPCPLTPLEQRLRRWAGQGAYQGGFVEHYLAPRICAGLRGRALERVVGLAVLVWNGLIYAALAGR